MMNNWMKNKKDHHRKNRMLSLGFGLLLIVMILLAGGIAGVTDTPGIVNAASAPPEQVEPEAGTWQTWVLESGSQVRLPAPPDEEMIQQELAAVKELAGSRDEAGLDQIAFWNTGPAVYRWNEIAVNEALKNNTASLVGARVLALLNIAMYDGTIAAWDSKYAYDRPRPSEVDPSIQTVIPNPNSPSYPGEHAVVAGAASEVLAYLFPDNAAAFREQAEEAGQAFVLAGVQYPSDVEAGLELGRQVAALVIERARQDGSDAPWDGVIPSEPGHWSGENPVAPMVATWETWVLSSPDEFRPEPPFPYDSAELTAELDELKNVQPSRKMIVDAFFNEYGIGGARNFWFWNDQAGKKLLEYRLDDNLPRAARTYALFSIAYYDTSVACWDAKYAYWAIRPFQLDPTFEPIFKTPNHPSYPAAHACVSHAAAEMMAHLFPRDAETFRALADVAGESRIWAGIHFRSDVDAGAALGRAVAQKVIERAQNDGSQ